MRQRFAPGKQPVLARASDVVRILLDELYRTRATLNLEHPQPPNVVTTVLFAEAAGHWNLGVVLLEKLQMIELVRAAYVCHWRAVLEHDDEAHTA